MQSCCCCCWCKAWKSSWGEQGWIYKLRGSWMSLSVHPSIQHVSDDAWDIYCWRNLEQWIVPALSDYTKLPVGDAIIKCQNFKLWKAITAAAPVWSGCNEGGSAALFTDNDMYSAPLSILSVHVDAWSFSMYVTVMLCMLYFGCLVSLCCLYCKFSFCFA